MPIQPPGPPVIPPLPPKKGVEKPEQMQKSTVPSHGVEIGRGPEYDSQAVAVRLAALAMDAKEKELSFETIIEKVIKETGITNPQAAMEEANKKLQEEIEKILENIKQNKELMEEAEAWQAFADILQSELTEEQIKDLLGLIDKEVYK